MFNEQLDRVMTVVNLLLNCPHTFNNYKTIEPYKGIVVSKTEDGSLQAVANIGDDKCNYPVKFRVGIREYSNGMETECRVSMICGIFRNIVSSSPLSSSYNNLLEFAYATLNACSEMFREYKIKANI